MGGPGKVVVVRAARCESGAYTVPGDPSQAAFWLVGATIVPGSLVTVDDIVLGPERLGFLGVLRRMGATIEVDDHGDGTGSVTAYTCALHGTVVEASEIPSLDEVPILAVAAAGGPRPHPVPRRRRASGEGVRPAGGHGGTGPRLRRRADADGDDLVVEGTGEPLRPGRFDARGRPPHGHGRRHRRRGLPGCRRATTVTGWDAVATSYPGFADDLDRLTSPAAGQGSGDATVVGTRSTGTR